MRSSGTEMDATGQVPAQDLRPGMVIIRPTADALVRVEILGPRELWTDRFGIERLWYWARRRDTGQEGWMLYGYGALIPVDDTEE